MVSSVIRLSSMPGHGAEVCSTHAWLSPPPGRAAFPLLPSLPEHTSTTSYRPPRAHATPAFPPASAIPVHPSQRRCRARAVERSTVIERLSVPSGSPGGRCGACVRRAVHEACRILTVPNQQGQHSVPPRSARLFERWASRGEWAGGGWANLGSRTASGWLERRAAVRGRTGGVGDVWDGVQNG